MPRRGPGPVQRVHPYCVVLIVPSMRMLLNDSSRRTPGRLGWVRPRPQCSWIHRPSTVLAAVSEKPRGSCKRLQRAPEGLSRGALQRGARETWTWGVLSVRKTGTKVQAHRCSYLRTSRKNAPPRYTASDRSCANMRGTRLAHRRYSTEHGCGPVLASSISSPLTP